MSHTTWCCNSTTLGVAIVFDDYLGVTDALVRCDDCGRHALANLLDWSPPKLGKRAYALSHLPATAVEVFFRDARSAYCDLTRMASERQALEGTAAPVFAVVVATLPDLAISRVLAVKGVRRPDWRTDLASKTSSGWLQRLEDNVAG